MSKHTPGPWKAVYVGCSDWDLSGPTTQEDWKLAAAAPDLLEALKEVFADHDAVNRLSWNDRAAAAIAKIGGAE